MPKECFSEIQAREMRIKRKMEQREHEKKLRALEKAQEAAREGAEIASLEIEEQKMREAEKEEKKTAKALLDVENNHGLKKGVKAKQELDTEKEARQEERRK